MSGCNICGCQSTTPDPHDVEITRLRAIIAERYSPFDKLTAEVLADEVAVLVRRGVLDSRSPVADALLDYRNPPPTERSDRMAVLEAEVERLTQERDSLRTRLETLTASGSTHLFQWLIALLLLVFLHYARDLIRGTVL